MTFTVRHVRLLLIRNLSLIPPKVSEVKNFNGCGIEFSDEEIKVVFTSCSGEVIGEYIVKVG